jgi:anti-sigma28 factor (negative regulator of flagellin synthesis)
MACHKRRIPHLEIQKVLGWFEDTPSPNEGRIKELKETIQKGRYPSKKMIHAAAKELILRFQGRRGAL